MSRILPGIVEQVEVDIQAIPSQVEVVHLWKLVNKNLDDVEGIFSLITRRLRKLRKWQHRGFVESVRVDFCSEKEEALWSWFRQIREMIIDVGDFDMPNLQDGAGI